MNTRLLQFASAAWLFILSAQSAGSQSSLYYDRGSFVQACQAVPGIQESISYFFGPNPSDEFGPTLTMSNVTFTGRYLIRSVLTSGTALYNFDGTQPLSIHFANGARAFGGEFSSQLSPYYSSFTATLSLDNGERFNFTAQADPSSTFFGFISPTPVKEVTFSDGGLFGLPPRNMHEEMIGNLFMVLEVPEPNTLGLFALAALFLGWRFRRNRT